MEKALDYCNSEIHTIDIFRYDMRSFRYDMRSDNNDACIQISRYFNEACLGLVFTSKDSRRCHNGTFYDLNSPNIALRKA
jgi:hypothetical protein